MDETSASSPGLRSGERYLDECEQAGRLQRSSFVLDGVEAGMKTVRRE